VASPFLLRLPRMWLCFLSLRIGADGGRRLPILPFAAEATSAANEGIVSLKFSVKKKTMPDEKCFTSWINRGSSRKNSTRSRASFRDEIAGSMRVLLILIENGPRENKQRDEKILQRVRDDHGA